MLELTLGLLNYFLSHRHTDNGIDNLVVGYMRVPQKVTNCTTSLLAYIPRNAYHDE